MRNNSAFEAFDPSAGFDDDSDEDKSVYIPQQAYRMTKVTRANNRVTFGGTIREDEEGDADVLGRATTLTEESKLISGFSSNKKPGLSKAKSVISRDSES